MNVQIQLQTDRVGCGSIDMLSPPIETCARKHVATQSIEITSGFDDGRYTNIDIKTVDVRALWNELKELIVDDVVVSNCAIVCCEGDNGWDDYLLLHHFDETETLDALT